MYTCAISLKFDTRAQRDTALKAIRSMLLSLGFAPKGKVRMTVEAEIDRLGLLPLFPFGVEFDEPTPIEQASYASEAAERVGDDVPLDEALENALDWADAHREAVLGETEAELASEEPAPLADDAGDDEPPTPFDKLLGRELPDNDE